MWKRGLTLLVSFISIFIAVQVIANNRDVELYAKDGDLYDTIKDGDTFVLGEYNGAGVKWVTLEKGEQNGKKYILAMTSEPLTAGHWNSTCYANKNCNSTTTDYYLTGEMATWLSSNFMPSFLSDIKSPTPNTDGLGKLILERSDELKSSNADILNPYIYIMPLNTPGTFSTSGEWSDSNIAKNRPSTWIGFNQIRNKNSMICSTSEMCQWWFWLSTPGDGIISSRIDAGILAMPSGTWPGDNVSLVFSTYTYRPSLYIELDNKPLELTYTSKPQNSMTSFEYSKNVAPGTKVGELAYQDGTGTPTLSIVADPNAPSGHGNNFQNFEITTAPTTSPVDVKIKATGAPDIVNGSLMAGDYYFRIEGIDANGDPNPAIYQDVHIIVNKTTPTLTISTTTKKDIKIGDSVFTDTVTTSNTEFTSSDISYSLSGGISGVLNAHVNSTDPLKYDVSIASTHTGIGLPTTYTLSATLKQTDNFNGITTTTNRDFYAYKSLSNLTWSPSRGSYSTTDVTSGAVVGTLLAVDGVGPFTYEVTKSGDTGYNATKAAENGDFVITNTPTVAGTAVDVKTKSALLSKTYNMQFKVSDTKGDEKYVDASITVNSKGQAALDFKDSPGGTIITSTGKKIKFDDKSSSLLAEGGSTSNAIEYDFAPNDMQPGGVSAPSYATINKTNGLITPIRTGTIKVQAKRPGDSTFGDIITYMDLTIEPAEQKIAFNDTSSVINIKEGASKKVDAIGTIKSSGLAGIGSIVYSIDDTTTANVNSSTGDVTGIKAGTVTLTATMNKSGESGYDSNYDTVTSTKSIKIYKGMSVTWSAASPKLKANANAIGSKAGTLTVTDNASDPSFAISSNSTVENADASFFKVVDNGATADVQLAKTISASDWASHGGSFKVQVDATDSNGTQTTDVVVTLDEADNDVYFMEGGSKITSLTKTYGENSNTFTLTSKTDGVGTTYSEISDPNGVLNVLGTGAVTVNKAGSATVQVLAGAGNGYAQKTVTMVVTIDSGDQSIAFKDAATLNRPFVLNSTFSELAELKETSLDTVSTRNITYTSNDTSVCDIDSITGIVTMKTKGNCDITASNSDANWTEVITTKVINLYDGMGVSFKQTNGLQAEVANTNAGASAGSLTVNGGIDPKTYAISTATGAKNKDASLFQVNSSGIVSFKKTVMASDLVGKYNTTKKIYELYVQIETTDSLNTKVTTDAIVEIKGAPLKASFDTKGTGKITEVYGAGKSFTLDLSSNKGGGTPTYQLKNDASMPSDVLQSVDASGLVTILHANDKTFVGNPLKVEAIIPPSNGYDGETIETEVEITQATQPDFAFVTPNIKLGHEASITPTFTGQLASGTISMTSGNNALATINGNDIKAKTTDGTVTITAIESGDRDYKRTTTTATVTVSSAPAYNLVLNVPSATYGDTGLMATVILNDATGGNQAQTWSSSDPSIAEIAQGTKLDESGVITIHKAGTITISCTQTSTGEPSVTATAILVIDPKPITVTIDNASKYVGEAVPNFHATIPTSELVGSDTIGQPVFSCKDGSALVDTNTKAGKYDINATYPTGNNPNYAITITKGELTIKQDTSQADWYHLEEADSATTLNPNDWHKEDVQVVIDSATESAGTYDEISLDNTLWDTTILVNTEGNLNKDIAFRIKDTKAISTTQTTTVKIDKTKPTITEITGTEANRNALEELLNKLTNGKYFKPHLEVSIKAEDILPKGVNENSKLKAIHYDAYQLKSDGTLSDVIASGEMKSTDVLKLVDEGMYMVCATAEDGAGNISDEKCSGIRIHKIGESSDDKELPDINIDYDGDGVADINITRPGEKKPYLNIDINGDGIADINISRDGEEVIPGTTEPFLNIISPETKWNPIKEIDFDKDGIPDFRTDASLEAILFIDANGDKIPDLNIDLDDDYIPEINIDANGDKTPETNIDSDGDMKADINIDKIGNGIPTEGICTTVIWNPTKMVEKDGKVIYATTPELKPDVKDSLTDNGITIKPKPGDNTTFLPNYALKVDDVTESVDEQTKNTIIEITGSDSEVKQVFDVSLSDGEKIIQPNGSILVRIPVDTSIKNPRVLVKNAKGVFKEVSVSIEDGFYVFETDYLGLVSIVGDKEIVEEPLPTPDKEIPTYQKPETSVKGTYTGGVGGAGTGDSTNVLSLSIICMVMGITLVTIYRKEM